MSSISKTLKQEPFFYTAKRVFRLYCGDTASAFKGGKLHENFFAVVNELMDKLVEIYDTDQGQSFKKLSTDSYEVRVFSSIISKDFTVLINYLDENGRKDFSSSLYYFEVELVA